MTHQTNFHVISHNWWSLIPGAKVFRSWKFERHFSTHHQSGWEKWTDQPVHPKSIHATAWFCISLLDCFLRPSVFESSGGRSGLPGSTQGLPVWCSAPGLLTTRYLSMSLSTTAWESITIIHLKAWMTSIKAVPCRNFEKSFNNAQFNEKDIPLSSTWKFKTSRISRSSGADS